MMSYLGRVSTPETWTSAEVIHGEVIHPCYVSLAKALQTQPVLQHVLMEGAQL